MHALFDMWITFDDNYYFVYDKWCIYKINYIIYMLNIKFEHFNIKRITNKMWMYFSVYLDTECN